MSEPNPAKPALPVNPLRQEQLAIGGMRCAACAQLIEYRLQQLVGVQRIQIDLVQQRAQLAWQPQQTSLRQIIDVVNRLGYRALPLASSTSAVDAAGADRQESKQALWRLFVAGFAMMQIMMLAFPAYLQPMAQIDGDLTPDIDQLLKLASLLLSVPVMIFSAKPFLQRAWHDLSNRHIGMDVPIAAGILSTFIASVWATFTAGPVYYDSFVMFVFLLLAVRWLEARVQLQSSAAVRELTTLLPLQAERYRNYPHSQEIDLIDASQVQVGDILRVRPGSAIAVDGEVLQGTSEVDEAMMTGEAQAVRKSVGAAVLAGAMNLNALLVIRAQQVGNQTQFANLLNLMQSAAQHKPRWAQMAERWASKILAAILLLALLAFGLWYRIEPARAWQIAISVMVVTCPCALSLATPGVMAALLGRLAKNGVLVVRGEAVETLARASHFVFDKTGTLTSGQLQVVDSKLASDSTLAPSQILACAKGLASASLHPAAQALAQFLRGQASANSSHLSELGDLCELSDLSETPGSGISAQWQGQTYRLGAPAWVAQLYSPALPMLPTAPADSTLVCLGHAQGMLAWFALQDTVRPDAATLIAYLQHVGKTVSILSGDRAGVVAQLAAQVGIYDARAALSPQQKYQAVQQLQQQGAIVAMVGDGMNDGPVLSLADVAIAMGQGAPISQARSDVVLVSSHLADLQLALKLSRFAYQLIRQNLAWALLYNLLAIPAAMAGMLNPWQAALGMSLSSLFVVMNALRLLRVK